MHPVAAETFPLKLMIGLDKLANRRHCCDLRGSAGNFEAFSLPKTAGGGRRGSFLTGLLIRAGRHWR